MNRTYIAIDLKSFFASVECVERGLDPMTTNLVVADLSRTEKTICLAVTPSLKAYGISGRARLFEVIQQVKIENARRRQKAPGGRFTGVSSHDPDLKADPSLELDYIVAPPHMAKYMDYSTRVYQIYLKYIAPEDIHVYSIDEVFIDATAYLRLYGLTPRELAMKLILDVLADTGITATAGIGTNLYLCKVALDIGAKHITPDENGVRIAELDEMGYRRQLWAHRPITDFWRVGRGTAARLEAYGMYTMGDVARCSVKGEDLLYRLFGVNAELLIDHAWGYEPCTIAHIKAYKPASSSLGMGQVLQAPYTFDKAKLVLREMLYQLSLDLLEKGLVADQIVLTVGYDTQNLADPAIKQHYTGEITTDKYGRSIPRQAHGSANIGRYTSSARLITDTAIGLYDRLVNAGLLIRRMSIAANHVVQEDMAPIKNSTEQLDMFTDYQQQMEKDAREQHALLKERSAQEAMLAIRKKYGKNAILMGTSLQEGATAMDRNHRIGGHHE